MNQMIQMSLIQIRRNKKADDSSNNLGRRNLGKKSGKRKNTTTGSVKKKHKAAKLTHAKEKGIKKAVDKTIVTYERLVKIEEIEGVTGTKRIYQEGIRSKNLY